MASANPNMNQNQGQSQFRKHTSDFKDKVSDLNSDVQEIGKITKNMATEAVGMIRENSSGYLEQGKEKFQQIEKTMETKIRENPTKALLIAGAVGLVAGLIWLRK